jgi:polysaccharide biosynthesis protein PslG
MLTRSVVRKKIRGFVLVWIGITLIMSTATFFAIYLTYGGGETPGSNLNRTVAIPFATVGAPIVAVPTNTRAPTEAPTQPATATSVEAVAAAVTQLPTSTPSVEPTLLPVNDKKYAVGIQVQHSLDFNPDNQDGWMRPVAEQLGLSWIKHQVRWEETEREKGQFDWGILDLVMPSASKFDLKVMISVVTAPEWARDPGVDLTKHGPPANSQDYADFVAAILERYPGQIHAVEVWNEQNLNREWTSTKGLKAANYIELLRTAAQAIKAVDPGVIVISGALSPTGLSDGINAWDDFTYMDQMIQSGLLNYADCVGAHHNGINIGPSVTWDNVPNDPGATFRGPFDNPHHSWSFRSTLQTYANKVKAAGGEQKLCVTEFGWASTEDLSGTRAGFEFAGDNTLAEQEEWTAEALSNMEEWDIVWLAFIWNFNYGPQAGWDVNNDNVPYSLIGPDFTFRPAYDAIREWQADYKTRTGRS